jgi:hypothetical protein
MSDKVTDINEFRRKKVMQAHLTLSKDSDAFKKEMLKQYVEYVSMMKLLVKNEIGIKMEDLYFYCIAEDDAEFKNSKDALIDYIALFSEQTPDGYENEDLIIDSLTKLAPRRIIIRDSAILHEEFLRTITEIFGERVVVES